MAAGTKTEELTYSGDGPVQFVLDPGHQVVAVSVGEKQAWHQDVPEAQEAVGVGVAHSARVSGEVGNPQHHRELFIRGMAGGHLNHDALPSLHEEWSYEDEENVVEEESAEQDGADLQTLEGNSCS